MKAIIEINVPEWQIGQQVSIYFPDTMTIKGTCKQKLIAKWYNTSDNAFYLCSYCAARQKFKAPYCHNCGAKMVESEIEE